MKEMYVKGVNLGNWLVLEKWMSPGLFDGTTAEDEYYLPTQLPKEIYEERIRMHRSEYITERDFTRIRAMGMDAVRIPVPYFIFGDRAPFVGCVKELDNAFNWAEKYGKAYIVCGPIYDSKSPKRIGKHKIAVPERFFKAILIYEGKTPIAMGFLFENKAHHQNLKNYLVSVDKIEEETGLDFFSKLPDTIESRIESTIPEMPE